MGMESLCFGFSSISYHRQNGLELDYELSEAFSFNL